MRLALLLSLLAFTPVSSTQQAPARQLTEQLASLPLPKKSVSWGSFTQFGFYVPEFGQCRLLRLFAFRQMVANTLCHAPQQLEAQFHFVAYRARLSCDNGDLPPSRA